jgi:hypothetical protein
MLIYCHRATNDPPSSIPHRKGLYNAFKQCIHHNYEGCAIKKTVKTVGQEKTADFAPPL